MTWMLAAGGAVLAVAAAPPRSLLLAVALFNFLSVHNRYGGECAYNLSDAYREFFTLFVAAFALWPGRWWAYLGSAVLSGKTVFGFGYVMLAVFRLWPAGGEENRIAPEEWVRIMLNNPFEPFQGILAASIFTYAVMGLVKSLFRRRTFLP